MNLLLPPRTACPLCGTRSQRAAYGGDDILVCNGCAEMLYPHELVRLPTRWTRLAYNKTNNHSPLYGTPGGPSN